MNESGAFSDLHQATPHGHDAGKTDDEGDSALRAFDDRGTEGRYVAAQGPHKRNDDKKIPDQI